MSQHTTANDGNDSNRLGVEESTFDRDRDGNLRGEDVYVDELAASILAIPMDRAARERYLEPLQDGDGGLSDERLAGFIDEHVADPDYTEHPECSDERVTAKFVNEYLNPTYEDGLFIGVLLASGEDRAVERMRAAVDGVVSQSAEDAEDAEGN